MYGIGQRVVHPMHGAGVIESVTEELLYGAARTYYVFRQAVSGLVLKLPTDNCEAIGVRLLYDRERMDAVLSAIPSLTVEEERNWNRRYRENMARLIFRHTTTLGIRESLQTRYTLERRTEILSTPYGAVRQKLSSGYGVQRQKAEYEDIASIARERGLSIAQVREMLK